MHGQNHTKITNDYLPL